MKNQKRVFPFVFSFLCFSLTLSVFLSLDSFLLSLFRFGRQREVSATGSAVSKIEGKSLGEEKEKRSRLANEVMRVVGTKSRELGF